VAVLKLIFYLCFSWLVVLTFITVLAMVISGMEAAQAFVKSFFETWYTGFAAVFFYLGSLEVSLLLTIKMTPGHNPSNFSLL
jgi:hypothetical protein